MWGVFFSRRSMQLTRFQHSAFKSDVADHCGRFKSLRQRGTRSLIHRESQGCTDTVKLVPNASKWANGTQARGRSGPIASGNQTGSQSDACRYMIPGSRYVPSFSQSLVPAPNCQPIVGAGPQLPANRRARKWLGAEPIRCKGWVVQWETESGHGQPIRREFSLGN